MQEIEITAAMLEAGSEVFGPFNRDLWESTPPAELEEMLRAVYLAMRLVEAGLDLQSGIQAGLALYPSQA